MTPDFRVPGGLKSEDGLEPTLEEQESENLETEESAEEESGEREETKRRSENTGVSRDAVHLEDQEWSEDTLRSRHVPKG
ncbi:hypothetical protein NDU88_005048 [Pleurodeles waltl]|uniref:Uncharacterized protein n=1 Tax=Pleurodeles waltl TaxID=8319 RepID=A0AAV7N047_PLEWA|nr:hypothetical protein NDU88_005048 [Pleurodeles waltl]